MQTARIDGADFLAAHKANKAARLGSLSATTAQASADFIYAMSQEWDGSFAEFEDEANIIIEIGQLIASQAETMAKLINRLQPGVGAKAASGVYSDVTPSEIAAFASEAIEEHLSGYEAASLLTAALEEAL
jgi:hypothetical protein